MNKNHSQPRQRAPWRDKIHEVIFEADTKAGKTFDVLLISIILLSVLVVMLESVAPIEAKHGYLLRMAEWVFTVAFTIEYILRIISVDHPLKYARSFFGVIDLLAIIPTYMSVLIPGTQFLLVIRLLRILRVFRVLKLAKFIAEADVLVQALRASRRKITVFLFTIITLVVILGSLMYFIENDENGFTSIPRSIYWAIVTLTTVGYGDISPQTPIGQALASVVMILGYAIIAVPTGIVSVEIARADADLTSTRSCHACSLAGHDANAVYCKYCGEAL